MKIKFFLLAMLVAMLSLVFVGCNEEEPVVEHVHQGVAVEAVAATCAAEGHTKYYVCDCGKYFSDENCTNEITLASTVIPKTDTHTWDDGIISVPAKEGVPGEKTYYCVVCGTSRTEEIPALEHTHNLVEQSGTEATCTRTGTEKYYVCVGCNKMFADAEGKTEITAPTVIPMKAHTLTAVAEVKATCLAEGHTAYYVCSECGGIFADADGKTPTTVEACVTSKASHDLEKHEAVAATCEKTGVIEYYSCKVCQKLFKDALATEEVKVDELATPKAAHTLTKHEAVAATCTSTGMSEYYTCDVCKKVFADAQGTTETTLAALATPKAAHTPVHHDAVAAKCTETGMKEYWECSVCNKIYSESTCTYETTLAALVTKAEGHKIVEVPAVAATCTTEGSKGYYKCSACGELFADAQGTTKITEADAVTPKIAHTLEHHEAVASTCLETGMKEYWECSVCHGIFADAQGTKETTLAALTIALADHKLVKYEAKDPTVTAEGAYEHYECSVCDKYFDVDSKNVVARTTVIIPALGDTNYFKKTVVAPTFTEKGYDVYDSEVYGQYIINIVDKLPNPVVYNTYYNVVLDGTRLDQGSISYYSYSQGSTASVVTFDEKGIGLASGFPFRGATEIIFAAGPTGKVTFRNYSLTAITEAQAKTLVADGGYVVTSSYTEVTEGWSFDEETEVTAYYTIDYNNYTDYVGYVSVDGTMVRAYRDTLMYPVLLTTEQLASTEVTAYKLAGAIIIKYGAGENQSVIYIDDERVYFNCYLEETENKDYIKVCDEELNYLAGFVLVDDTYVRADGYEGTYTFEDEEVILNGAGTITLNNVVGTYDLTEGCAIVGGKYYVLTVGEGTINLKEKTVTITYINGESKTEEEVAYKIANPLKALEDVGNNKFMGWYTDAACTKAVVLDADNKYSALEDVTLYAKYSEKVTFVLNNVKAGDATTVVFAIGETLSEAVLPYGTAATKFDLVNGKYFDGWYLDAAFETRIPAETEVTDDCKDVVLYAKWSTLPAYYGTYSGVNTDSNNLRDVAATLTIDELGNITGKYTGKVTDYNEKTGLVTATVGTKTMYFYFAKEAGVLVTEYYGATSPEMNMNDTWTFVNQTADVEKVITGNVGIHFENGENISVNRTRLVEVNNALGTTVLLYTSNGIQVIAKVQDAFGNDVDVQKALENPTLALYDAEGLVLAIGTESATLGTSKAVYVELDNFYGAHSSKFMGDVYFDGLGNVYKENAEKTAYDVVGSYEASTTENRIDVYEFDADGNKAKHYKITYTETSIDETESKVMIIFNSARGTFTPIQEFYTNVEIDLPALTDNDYVLKTWVNDKTEIGIGKYTFTEADDKTILTSKWVEKEVLTICPANETNNTTVTYGKGDKITLEKPVYEGHKFVGWFNGDTEVKDGDVINESMTVTAKWVDAPIYNKTYSYVRILGTSTNGGTTSLDDRSYTFAFDADGHATSNGYYPFYATDLYIVETATYATDHTIDLKAVKGDTVTIYHGFVDSETGMLIINETADSYEFNEVKFFTPFESSSAAKANISSSYWNRGENGITRVITYTYSENTYNIFIHNNKVSFNATLTDKAGNSVKGGDFFGCEYVYVNVPASYPGDTVSMYKFGYNGTTMVEPDALAGNYSGVTDSGMAFIDVDGICHLTVSGTKVEYTKISDNTVSYVLNNVYYELVLDSSLHTFTMSTPTVTFEYQNDGETSKESYSKTIEITLPTPTKEGYFFKGWLVDGATTPVTTLKADKDHILVASWVDEVKLTVVYNTVDGVELGANQEVAFGKGDTVDFEYPTTLVNGYAITGWTCNGADYTFGTINADMQIEAVWTKANKFYGKYTGGEIWGTSNLYTSNGKTLDVNVNGMSSSSSTPAYTTFVDTDGEYKAGTRGLAADLENGVVAVSYSSSTTTIGTDYYLYIFGQEKAQIDKTKTSQCNSGTVRFITVTLDDGSEMVVFVNGDKIYGNVSFVSADDSINAANAGTSTIKFLVKDSNGDVVARFQNVNGVVSEYDAAPFVDKDLYIAYCSYGSYAGAGNSVTGSVKKSYYGDCTTLNYNDVTEKVVISNAASSGTFSSSVTVTFEDYDEETGFFYLHRVYNSKDYYSLAYADQETGVIICAYAASATSGSKTKEAALAAGIDSFFIMTPYETTDFANKVGYVVFDSKQNVYINYRVNEEVSYNYYIENGSTIYTCASLVDYNGEALSTKDAKNAFEAVVMQEDDVVVKWGYNGTKMVNPIEGYASGTYLCGFEEVTIRPYGLALVDGTCYSCTKDGKIYVITNEAGTYYAEARLGHETCILKHPMVTLSVVTPDGVEAIDDVKVFKGLTTEIAEAPERENQFFVGYYSDAEYTKAITTVKFLEDGTVYARYVDDTGLTSEKAATIVLSDGEFVGSAETFATAQKYYAAFTPDATDDYYVSFDSNNVTKLEGNITSKYYLRFTIYDAEGTKVLGPTSGSYTKVSLEKDKTYTIVMDLGNTYSSSYTAYGTFTYQVNEFAQDTAAEAVEIALGVDNLIAAKTFVSSAHKLVYKFVAPETAIYRYYANGTGWNSVTVYSDEALSQKVMYTSASANTTVNADLSVTKDATYYLVFSNNWSKTECTTKEVTFGVGEYDQGYVSTNPAEYTLGTDTTTDFSKGNSMYFSFTLDEVSTLKVSVVTSTYATRVVNIYDVNDLTTPVFSSTSASSSLATIVKYAEDIPAGSYVILAKNSSASYTTAFTFNVEKMAEGAWWTTAKVLTIAQGENDLKNPSGEYFKIVPAETKWYVLKDAIGTFTFYDKNRKALGTTIHAIAGETYYAYAVKDADLDACFVNFDLLDTYEDGKSVDGALTYTTGLTLDPATGAWYIKFTAPTTGLYRFYSVNTNRIDTKGYIYTDDQFTKLLASNDDGGSTTEELGGYKYDFFIARGLTEGTTYYVKVTFSANTSANQIKLVIEEMPN